MPIRSEVAIVPTALTSLPNPVSASAMIGRVVTSAIWDRRVVTSVKESRPMSGTPPPRAIAPPLA